MVVWQILFPGTFSGQCEVCAVEGMVWSGCCFFCRLSGGDMLQR